jgi:beta-lactamase class D
MVRVQEEQIGNLKEMLNQTINVKIKYENIIKKLIENDRSRDYVLAVIENMQQPP